MTAAPTSLNALVHASGAPFDKIDLVSVDIASGVMTKIISITDLPDWPHVSKAPVPKSQIFKLLVDQERALIYVAVAKANPANESLLYVLDSEGSFIRSLDIVLPSDDLFLDSKTGMLWTGYHEFYTLFVYRINPTNGAQYRAVVNDFGPEKNYLGPAYFDGDTRVFSLFTQWTNLIVLTEFNVDSEKKISETFVNSMFDSFYIDGLGYDRMRATFYLTLGRNASLETVASYQRKKRIQNAEFHIAPIRQKVPASCPSLFLGGKYYTAMDKMIVETDAASMSITSILQPKVEIVAFALPLQE